MLTERTFICCTVLPPFAALFISVPAGLAVAAVVFALRPRQVWHPVAA